MRRLALLVTLLWPALAGAHPHVWVDWRAAWEIGEDGRVAAVRLTWAFDEFYTLLLLEELGIDPAAPGAEGLARLGALQSEWSRDFGGEGTLSIDGAPVELGAPEAGKATLDAGRLAITFRRALPSPADPRAAEVAVAVYDPGFFVAYTLVEPVTIEGGTGCAGVMIPFDPDSPELSALQGSLLQLGPDETPPDRTVGRLFADKATLTCG